MVGSFNPRPSRSSGAASDRQPRGCIAGKQILEGKFDVKVLTEGGGIHGQAGAVRLGIARALLAYNAELRPNLRRQGFLTRDPRAKERKKYGQKGARKKFQWTKR